ncbi:radical SAM protein [archaeon]|nr:radical SAM protein [archaeon]
MTYSPFRHAGSALWKRGPIQLTFFVTRACNANCPFCFYLQSKSEKTKEEELTLGEIRKISKSMGSLLWLLFSGGEIYLRRDIADITKTFYDNNRPAIITLPTNGLLPDVIFEKTEEILKHCKKSVVAVKLSLDGIGEEHDKIRGTEGNFKNLMETYETLSPLLEKYPNFELGINTVFCSENQDKMDEIIDFVKTLENAKTHTLSMIRGELASEGYKDTDLILYRKAVLKMEGDLKEGKANIYRFKGARLKAAQDILQRRLIYETQQKQKRLIPCYGGALNIVLSENGDVYPCELSIQKMGNIRDFDFDIKKLLNSKEAKSIARDIKKGDCYCSHECYFMTNILFNPKMYPKLLKEYLSLSAP